MHVADDRQRHVRGVRRQERIAEKHRAGAGQHGGEQPDGAGEHSPFTNALLQNLATPGQDLRKSLGYVRDAVMKATANQQEPYVYGSLGGDDVILVPGPRAAASRATVLPSPPAPDPAAAMRLDYELAAQVNTKPAWDAFIAAHPDNQPDAQKPA